MAQLYYHYGAMNSGKTIEILKVEYSYKEQNKPVLLLTSSLDNRTGVGLVGSRIGITRPAVNISPDNNMEEIITLIKESIENNNPYYAVLVDEVQFFTKEQIKILSDIADFYDVPVLCYGLKNDFQNNLFEGSQAMLTYADKIIEIKTVCQYCNRKAIMNLRLVDGKVTHEGEQIQIGGNESYISVCRKCYKKSKEME